ncbi:MAG: hypothetical protein QXE31_01575 [Candidatus Woesearchaeota archaeon]
MRKELILANLSILIILFFYSTIIQSNSIIHYDEFYYLNEIKDNLFVRELYTQVKFLNNISEIFLFKFIMILIFIINILLIDKIAKKLKIDSSFTFFIMMSPSFIYIHLIYNSFVIPFFITLIATYVLIQDNYIISSLLYLLTLILNPYFFYIIILILSLYYSYIRENNKITFFIIIILSYIFSLIKAKENFFIISDFGSNGISIFLILLSTIGAYYFINNNKRNLIILFIIPFIYYICLLEENYIIFLTIIIAFFASYAYEKISKNIWETDMLKNYVLILIFCGLLFSTLSFLNNLKKDMPEKIEIKAYEWLAEYEKLSNNKENTTKTITNKESYFSVLNDYNIGFILKYYNLTPYTDKEYYKYSSRVKINETEKIIKSRNLKEIINFLRENKIKYIIINKNLKDKIGKKEDDGILLILQNTRNFKKIYYYKDITIWEFLN